MFAFGVLLRSSLLAITLFGTGAVSSPSCPSSAIRGLRAILSNSTSVSTQLTTNESRWSEYDAPTASLYVQVRRESDIAAIVQFANLKGYDFLVQNGGNGWATTFHLEGCSILIDISELRSVEFNNDRTHVTVAGGVRVQDLVAMAAGNSTRVATATCNCVGFLGAALGGGVTRVAGLYGLSVDQLLEVNVVLASGDTARVNAYSNPDLWWALRGAAPNFAIVTSAVVKSYPTAAGQNVAWQGTVVFDGDKVEEVLQAIGALCLQPNMELDFTFATSGPPDYKPLVSVVPFFVGNASAGEAAFASILELGPIENTATEVAYSSWNQAGDGFCARGGFKPAYGASLRKLDVPTWTAVFEKFSAFVASNTSAFGNSAIVAERYPTEKTVAIGGATSSYPFRDLGYHVLVIPIYTDPSLNDTAVAFASMVRNMWWATAGTAQNSSYINFAHGDETLSTIYGDSLPRLQELKQLYDPFNRFNQWFPLNPDTVLQDLQG